MPGIDGIRRAVDAGEPLLPLLTRLLDVKPWMLHHLSDYQHAYFEVFEGDLSASLSALRWATPELAPRCAYQLCNIVEASAALSSILDWHQPENQKPFYRLIDQRGLVMRLTDFTGFVRHLANWITVHIDRPCSIGSRLGITKLPEWLELSHRWRQITDAQMSRNTPAEAPDGSSGLLPVRWSAVFTGPVTHQGYDMHCLANRQVLLAESRIMGHCIATYLGPAMKSECHILSLRRGPERVATIDVRFEEDRRFVVEDAAGPCNDPLSVEVWDAIETFVERLNAAGDDNPCRHGQLLSDEEQKAARRALMGLEYYTAERLGEPFEHFTALAETFGEQGLAQYRPCLELTPGRGTLYQDALCAARNLKQLTDAV